MFNKLRDFLGFNEPEEYDEYYEEELNGEEYQSLYQEENAAPAVAEEPAGRRRNREKTNTFTPAMDSSAAASRNNVIGMPGVNTGVSEVVVFEPRSFEEMPQVIQCLRERRSVVLNLNIMDPDEAQRAVDFVAGGTYAIDGHQERIGESIFLFTPNCVQVTTQSSIAKDVNAAKTVTPPPSRVAAPAWAPEPPKSAAQ
jgi:cell division inhibitor SepF